MVVSARMRRPICPSEPGTAFKESDPTILTRVEYRGWIPAVANGLCKTRKPRGNNFKAIVFFHVKNNLAMLRIQNITLLILHLRFAQLLVVIGITEKTLYQVLNDTL